MSNPCGMAVGYGQNQAGNCVKSSSADNPLGRGVGRNIYWVGINHWMDMFYSRTLGLHAVVNIDVG